MRARRMMWIAALLLSSTAYLQSQEPTAPPVQSDPPKIQTAPTQPHGPARISGGAMAGQLVFKVNPVYPHEAKEKHIRGTVVLHVIITKAGTIERLDVI